MMKNLMLAAVLAAAPMAASAATLTGSFTVQAVNVTGISGNDSQATLEDFNTALTSVGVPGSTAKTNTFTYNGELDFRINGGNSENTSIGDWLNTGTLGGVSGLSDTFAALRLSFPDINTGTATTTFFLFTLNFLGASEFTVTHDDGFAIFDGLTRVGGVNGPVAQTTTNVSGFDGGPFSLLYVATNGNPSILEVDATAVPLPAGAWLLLTGLGALGVASRRRRAAA